MSGDYIYTINQAALILNRSDRVIRRLISEGAILHTKRAEDPGGVLRVYISASSLADYAERREITLNYQALEEYTSDRRILEATFRRGMTSEPKQEKASEELSDEGARRSLPIREQSDKEDPVVAFLKEQLEKVEKEKEELKKDLREKDRQMEEKNRELLEATRESGRQYQLIALAKEQAEAQFSKLQERTRILHLSTNRDIERLREGKLQASDISLLPVASDTREGEFESEPPRPPYEPPSPPVRETLIDVAPGVDEPVDVAQEEDAGTASSPAEEEEGIAPTISEPENIERPKSRKQEKPAAKKKSAKKEPEKPAKRGFFRRLFG